MPQVGAFLSGAFGLGAAPVIGGAAAGAWATGAAINTFFTSTVGGQLLAGVATSALSQALRPRPQVTVQGIRSQFTSTGGTNPASFVLGYYATEGQFNCPPMSHGQADRYPNAYLTYVIELGDIPGQDVAGLFIDGAKVTIGAAPLSDYGNPIEGAYLGYAWIKTYDGTQTVADPMLLDKYGSYPERPWGLDMVGAGIPYAILTFRINPDLYRDFPKVRFETNGIPLYDPRKDDTVGGSGAHRWGDVSTWEPSSNGPVQCYNIKRGITLSGGQVWGGDAEAEDLPLSNWFAAMNAADQPVNLPGGGTEPAYRTGLEVFVSDEPAAICEEIGKASAMQFTELAGVFKVRVGGPGLPVMFITDDDFVVSEGQDYDPFPDPAEVFTGVHATYPEPANGWNPKDAPAIYDADFEAEDGDQNVADVTYSAAPYGNQVQRLNHALLAEQRRLRRHAGYLVGLAGALEPLDAVSWVSERYGYTAKTFEIAEHLNPLRESKVQVMMRERDASDFDPANADEQPYSVPSNVVVLPTAQTLAGWSVVGVTLQDSAGGDRGPALQLTWPVDDDGIAGIAYEVRVQATGAPVTSGTFMGYDAGSGVISAGILPGLAYQVRALIVPTTQRNTAWSVWVNVTAPTVRVAGEWYSSDVSAAVTGLTSTQVAAFFALDPAIPAVPGDKYTLTDIRDAANPIKAGYTFDGVAWVQSDGLLTGNWLLSGELEARHFKAKSITADLMQIAHLSAISAILGSVDIREALIMRQAGASFLGGKQAAGDLLTPGYFFGRRQRANQNAGSFVPGLEYKIISVGTTNFTAIGADVNEVGEVFRATGVGSGSGVAAEIGYELSVTSDSGGKLNGFSISDSGAFKLFNPVFYTGTPSTSPVTYTVGGTYNFGSANEITLTGLGGGGAGGAGDRRADSAATFGGNGGDTVVQVYDGDPSGGGVLKGTYTALGGLGGKDCGLGYTVGEDGEGSTFGSGGKGGLIRDPNNPGIEQGQAPVASAYGAGGGGAGAGSYWAFGWDYGSAGKSGKAGDQVTWDVDTSGFVSDIWLVVTIGAAGQPSNTGLDHAGGPGRQGLIQVTAPLAGMTVS